jgi:3-hydroxyisobutyrate dehydrogenase-like beta-hydroxyacid dehydrogenase
MMDIGLIGLGHMGFPLARRRRSGKRDTRDDGQGRRSLSRRGEALGVPVEIAEAVGRLWEATLNDEGADSDFTSAIKPIERAAGVTVGNSEKGEWYYRW